ncbi:MAG: hypothetical protein GXX11_02990 [Acholeplasmataceae bacterium]|nr:hypothetical protein [Acholeplasmataceae bacterium]
MTDIKDKVNQDTNTNKKPDADRGEYYVYMYSDPTDNNKPFYVGKGKDKRVESHLKDTSNTPKARKIQELRNKGKEPIIEILIHDVSEETALNVEATVIDLLKLDNLKNKIKGKGSNKYGRKSLEAFRQLGGYEELKRKDITENLIIIRINQLYYEGISAVDLYDGTRGLWRININRVKDLGTGELEYKYALAVYQGQVKEVYEIKDWYPAYSTFYNDEKRREPDLSDPKSEKLEKRYEFVGKIAAKPIRSKYHKKVIPDEIMPRRSQYPIIYCGPGKTEEEKQEIMIEADDN